MGKMPKLKGIGRAMLPDPGEEQAALKADIVEARDLYLSVRHALRETRNEPGAHIINAVELANLLDVRVEDVRRWARGVLKILRTADAGGRSRGPRPPKGGNGQSNL